MSRTRKQKLTGAKAVDHSCRNNGTCPWCTSNRTISSVKADPIGQLKEYLQTAPKEELIGDWDKVKDMSIAGPTLTEVLTMNLLPQSHHQKLVELRDGLENLVTLSFDTDGVDVPKTVSQPLYSLYWAVQDHLLYYDTLTNPK